ncbi:MAG: DUF3244 domain-containing protein [Bacteroidales bacterium]|nr:DUF3244 domain-containing protein [Bacteroidales bacterium]MBR0178001.1 DUF3244 domain-containing protein [Bacteroidales bacterium]
MKKKSIFLAGLFALGLIAWEAQATNLCHTSIINVEDNLPTGYETIELWGSLMMGTGPDAIVAGASRNAVYIHFNQSFGNVHVSIYNADGNLCYNGVVNTSVQQTVIIPITSNNDGQCYIVLNNANGEAEGEFTQE